GALEQMETVRLSGKLRGFDIQRLARAFAPQAAGYSGSISGDVQAAGNIKNTSDPMARVKLDIAPGTQGVPVSGRLNVDYAGRADTVTLAPSYVALPHTRLDLAGSLGQQIQVRLVTRDMADFKPVASVPVTFNGGSATVTA